MALQSAIFAVTLVCVVLTQALTSDAYPILPLSDWKGKGKSGNRRCQPHSSGGLGAICPGYHSECTRVNGPIFCSDSRAFNTPDYGLYHIDFATTGAVRIGTIAPRVDYCGGVASAPDGTLWGFGYDRIGFISNLWQFDSAIEGVIVRSYGIQSNDQKVADIVFDPFNGTMFAVIDAPIAPRHQHEWHVARVDIQGAQARFSMLGSTGLSVAGNKNTATTASLVILKTGEAIAIWVDPSVHWKDTKIVLVRMGPTDRERIQTWDITARVLQVCGVTHETTALASALRIDMHYELSKDRVWLWLQCRSNGMNQVTLAYLHWDENAEMDPARPYVPVILPAEGNGFYSKAPARGMSAFYDRHYCIDSE
jgi:hypothetical protein